MTTENLERRADQDRVVRICLALAVLGWLLGVAPAPAASLRRPKTVPFPLHTDPLAGLTPRGSFLWEGEPLFVESNWRDPDTGLAASLLLQRYGLFGAVEWSVVLQNRGPKESPVLEEVCGGDFELACGTNDVTLHYSAGSQAQPDDFRPKVAPLPPGQMLAYVPLGGRSSDGVMPYFNLARPGGGWIIAVGWSGQWRAQFDRDTNGVVLVRVGEDGFSAKLLPNESVRTPSVLVMNYQGDWLEGQNQFRRLMLAHFTPPLPGGESVLPMAASGAVLPYNQLTESNQLAAIGNVIREKLPIDMWWLDGGWMQGGFPAGQGNLDPDPVRFPRGLRPLADKLHQHKLRFLAWFEPERVMPGTALRAEHPEWLLAPTELPADLTYQASWRLLNLGNPEALAWLKTNVAQRLTQWGVDVYRHDCNLQPAFYWQTGEPPDRAGMTEAHYVMGLYGYLDYLRAHQPNLIIDNCASGGRRLDFEMLRRSVMLWRSDDCWHAEADQAKTYGLALWLPLQQLGAVSTNRYQFLSGLGSGGTYAFDYYSPKAPFWKPLAQLLQEQRQLRPFFTGNFYPLTAYSTEPSEFIAWQLHRPDLDAGLVQAFRRPGCGTTTVKFKLHGVQPEAQYLVTTAAGKTPQIKKGRELLKDGLTIQFSKFPEAALATYRRASGK